MWRWLVVVSALLILCRADPNLPTASATLQTVHAGSYIIPMDTNQYSSNTFNLKVYGLFFRLLRNNVPLWWVIKAGKAVDATDVTVNAKMRYPTNNSTIVSLDLKSGPFIIPVYFVETAQPIIAAYLNNIVVYELTTTTQMDVRFRLTSKIKVALLRDSGGLEYQIQQQYLQSGGCALNTDFDTITAAQLATFNNNTCYSIASEPHLETTNTSIGNAVTSFVQGGRNFLAQCAGVRSFEDMCDFQIDGVLSECQNGCNSANSGNLQPAAPFNQIIGNSLCTKAGGSLTDWAGTLYANGFWAVSSQNGYYFASARKVTSLNMVGGMTFYMGGHDWSACATTSIDWANSVRMFFNAIMTPAKTPDSCTFNVYYPPALMADTATTNEDTCVLIDVLANDVDPEDGVLYYNNTQIRTQPSNGVAYKNSTGILYCPTTNFCGTDTFTYNVTDSVNQTAWTNVTVTVTCVPDSPVAQNDYATTPEDTAVDIFVLANDTDIDNDIAPASLTIDTAPNPSTGTATVVSGKIVFTPASNYNGATTFVYQICDSYSLCSTATVYVTVTPVEDPPAPVGDIVTAIEDTPKVIDVLANDVDPENNINATSLAIMTTIPSSQGTLTKLSNNTILFTPYQDFCGTVDLFIYQICDDTGLCANATVAITVTCVGDAYIANDDAYTIPEDTPLFIDPKVNDTDIDGDAIYSTFAIVNGPQHGQVVVNTVTATFNYIPDQHYNGQDTMVYTICEAEPDSCHNATITITITPVNDAPVAVNDHKAVNESTSALVYVLDNDYDPDDNLNITSVTILVEPVYGNATVLENGTIYYVPPVAFVGNTSLIYQVCDTEGLCSNATLSLMVLNVDYPPIGVQDCVTLNEDTSVTLCPVTNDFDTDGDVLYANLTIVVQPDHGVIVVTNSCHIVYTPDANYNGMDSAWYIICDDTGQCSNATKIHFEISPVTDFPVAMDDNATTAEHQSVTINVTLNDSDPDNDLNISSVSIHSEPSNGVAQAHANGTITYTPTGHFNGVDSFVYKICDTNEMCDFATVNVIVTPVNDPPEAEDDTYNVAQGSLGNSLSVVDNDSDPDDNLDLDSITILTQPDHGTATVVGSGIVSYSATDPYVGDDAFEYEICDTDNQCDSAWVNITIYNVPDYPVAVDDYANVTEDSNYICINVTANDYDIDEDLDVTTLSIVVMPSDGDVVLNTTTWTLCYKPDADFCGTDGFQYSVGDETGLYADAYVTVTVTCVEDPPVAVDDSDTLLEDQVGYTIEVTENDYDPDDNLDIESVVILTQPDHGTATFVSAGIVSYVPDQNYNGPDSFTYQVCDTADNCDNATVSLTIVEVWDAPVLNDDYYTVATDAVNYTMAILANDTDIEEDIDPTTLLVDTVIPYALATIHNGTILYTSTSISQVGLQNFTYYVCDEHALCDSATVFVLRKSKVYPVSDTVTYEVDTEKCFQPYANDVDYDNNLDLSSINITSDVSNGTLTVYSNGTVCYMPDANYTGSDQAVYRICDTDGYCGTAYIHICNIVDCNANGVDDATDISNGTSHDCNGNGTPDECDISFFGSSDCNGDGYPDECQAECENIHYTVALS